MVNTLYILITLLIYFTNKNLALLKALQIFLKITASILIKKNAIDAVCRPK